MASIQIILHNGTKDDHTLPEKGQSIQIARTNDALGLTSPTTEADDNQVEDNGRDTTSLDFKRDAKIWQLYLEDAERDARERAELWRTGLDSLLIFAGLFAGIVSSFVIDARKDIQLHSEQALLLTISTFMLNNGHAESEDISASAQWTSALWVFSLYITLFGTIMGVLAKSWLTKFVPVTTRREARDACERYMLDKQAERWYLKEVFMLVPLLVQIASFLFLTGLVLQTRGDHPVTGYVLLASSISGGFVYLGISWMHLMKISSPFDTPLSELLLRFRSLSDSSKAASPHTPMDINNILADIVYTYLILSPNPIHVDEAISEIHMFKEKWIDFLCKNATARILLSRLNQSAATRTGSLARREDAISNCLLGLLKLTENYEKKVIARAEECQGDYALLHEVLHESLRPQNTLNRWNTLPERLRPLLFVVRTQVIMFLQHEMLSHWHTSNPFLIDFESEELQEFPWELALQDVPNEYRLQFTLATCRGLVRGRENVKIVSAFTMSVTIVKCGYRALVTGRGSDWTGNVGITDRRAFIRLASKYLTILYKEIARHWEIKIIEAIATEAAARSGVENDTALRWTAKATEPGSGPISNHEHNLPFNMFRFLMALLSETYMWSAHGALCVHATRMLQHAEFPTDTPRAAAGVDVQSTFATIIRITLEGTTDQQYTGIKTLVRLAHSDAVWREDIRRAIVPEFRRYFGYVEKVCSGEITLHPHGLYAGLDGAENSVMSIQDICFTIGRSLGSLIDSAHDILPDLIRLAFLTPEGHWILVSICLDARKLLKRMADSGRFAEAVCDAVHAHLLAEEEQLPSLYLLESFELFIDNDVKPTTLLTAFRWDDLDMEKVFPSLFSRFVRACIEGPLRSQICAFRLLKTIVRDERFRKMLDFQSLFRVDAFCHDTKACRNAILILDLALDYAYISDIAPRLLCVGSRYKAAHYVDDDNRLSCLKLVMKIVSKPEVTGTEIQGIQTTLVRLEATIIEEPQSELRVMWITLLGIVARTSLYPEAIKPVIHFFGIAQDSDTLNAALQFLGADFCVRCQGYYAPLENLVREGQDNESSLTMASGALFQPQTVKWARLGVEILRNKNAPEALVDVCRSGLRRLATATRTFLNADIGLDGHSRVLFDPKLTPADRSYWVELAVTLAEHDTSSDLMIAVLQLAIQESHSDVRVKCLQLFQRLLGKEETAIGLLLDQGHVLSQDQEPKFRLALAQSLGVVGCYALTALDERVIPLLIAIGLADNNASVRLQAIDSLTLVAKNAEGVTCRSLMDTVSQNLEAGLKDESSDVRKAWIVLVVTQVRNAQTIKSHLPDISAPISRLAYASITDEYEFVRDHALDHLMDLYLNCSPVREYTEQSLSNVIANSLQHTDASVRYNATRAVCVLTAPIRPLEPGNFPRPDVYGAIVAISVPLMMMMMMSHGLGEEDPTIRKAVEDIVFGNFAQLPGGCKVLHEIFKCLPALILEHPQAAEVCASQSIKTFRLLQSTATSLASALASIFSNRSHSSSARTVAIKLFSELSSKYHTEDEEKFIFTYAIPEVTELAFDERHGDGKLQVAAIELLANLSAYSPERFDTRLSSWGEHLTHLSERCMELLVDDNLRTSIVKLLSSLATMPSVRKKITLAVLATGLEGESLSMSQGHIELFYRLVADGRFEQEAEATDYIAILHLAAILDKPQFAADRLKFYTALWSRCGSSFVLDNAFQGDPPSLSNTLPRLHWDFSDDPTFNLSSSSANVLTDWFRYALFGQHTTLTEVTTWLEHCERWLPNEYRERQVTVLS